MAANIPWLTAPSLWSSMPALSILSLLSSYYLLLCVCVSSLPLSLFLKNFNLFLAALGLCCCVRTCSSCSEWGLLFSCISLQRLLLLQSMDFRPLRLSSGRCTGLVALWHVGSSRIRDRTCVPALASGFLITGPPGKSCLFLKNTLVIALKTHWTIHGNLPTSKSLIIPPPILFIQIRSLLYRL